jgi:acid phosphatase type 7
LASQSRPHTVAVVVLLLALLGGICWIGSQHSDYTRVASGEFVAKPYLQLGSRGGLSVVWQVAGNREDDWKFETKEGNSWKAGPVVQHRPLSIDSIEPIQLNYVDVTEFGIKAFDYRLTKNGREVFSAHANERARDKTHYTFAVMGDCGADTAAQRKVAYQLALAKPNFVLITGDIVYSDGRASEYLHHFFPVYNNETSSPSVGAPLMRSTLMAAVPGNHDIGKAALFDVRNMSVFADSMAYFYEWQQPLNGPGKFGEPNTPILLHNPERQQKFRVAAGENYPAMSTFFFDLANARFVMLDADHYMDWSNKIWRKWLDDALAGGKDKSWRFVLYHQTAFNSDHSHFSEQRMRLISDILEKHDVRIVFCGHVHNYQRTFPLHFKPNGADAKGLVSGEFEIASAGKPVHAGEIVYITTGGGGGALSGTQICTTPDKWQSFTDKFIARTHSFSLVEVSGKNLTFRQISEDGDELDRFTLSASPYPIQ